jgi:hypothetical protein
VKLAFELRSVEEMPTDAAPAAAPRMTEDELIDKLVAEFDAVVLPPDEEPA